MMELPRLTRALRLNPCDRPGRFKIKGAVIREIGRGKAKRLMARLTTEGPLSDSRRLTLTRVASTILG